MQAVASQRLLGRHHFSGKPAACAATARSVHQEVADQVQICSRLQQVERKAFPAQLQRGCIINQMLKHLSCECSIARVQRSPGRKLSMREVVELKNGSTDVVCRSSACRIPPERLSLVRTKSGVTFDGRSGRHLRAPPGGDMHLHIKRARRVLSSIPPPSHQHKRTATLAMKVHPQKQSFTSSDPVLIRTKEAHHQKPAKSRTEQLCWRCNCTADDQSGEKRCAQAAPESSSDRKGEEELSLSVKAALGALRFYKSALLCHGITLQHSGFLKWCQISGDQSLLDCHELRIVTGATFVSARCCVVRVLAPKGAARRSKVLVSTRNQAMVCGLF
jgi:hypothetical protein